MPPSPSGAFWRVLRAFRAVDPRGAATARRRPAGSRPVWFPLHPLPYNHTTPRQMRAATHTPPRTRRHAHAATHTPPHARRHTRAKDGPRWRSRGREADGWRDASGRLPTIADGLPLAGPRRVIVRFFSLRIRRRRRRARTSANRREQARRGRETRPTRQRAREGRPGLTARRFAEARNRTRLSAPRPDADSPPGTGLFHFRAGPSRHTSRGRARTARRGRAAQLRALARDGARHGLYLAGIRGGCRRWNATSARTT